LVNGVRRGITLAVELVGSEGNRPVLRRDHEAESSMSSLDLFFVFRSGFTILLGVIAIVVGVVRGSWETVGLGVVALVVGCGLLALQIWQIRHPVRPAPRNFFGQRGGRT
jgi:hypothetical protein